MNLEVEIYMSNVLKFFRDNPDELSKLVPQSKKHEFFDRIRQLAISNSEKGEEVTLTQNQIISLCVELNKNTIDVRTMDGIIFKTPYGEFSLN